MPAKSKAQQKAAGAALAAKRGETKKSSLKGASRQMVESMTREGAARHGDDAAQRKAASDVVEVDSVLGRRRLAGFPRMPGT